MPVSKRCDCGEVDRVECMCAFFEELDNEEMPDGWESWDDGIPQYEDIDWGDGDAPIQEEPETP